MSESKLALPSDSPGRKSPAAKNPATVNGVKSKLSSDPIMKQIPGQLNDSNAKTYSEKHEASATPLQIQDDIKNSSDFRATSPSAGKCIGHFEETESTGELRDQHPVSAAASCNNSAPSMTSENKVDNVAAAGVVPLLNLQVDVKDDVSLDNSANHLQEKRKSSDDGLPDSERMTASPSSVENKPFDCVHRKDENMPLADESEIDHINAGGRKCEKESVDESPCPPLDNQKAVDEGLHADISLEHTPVMAVCSEDITRNVDNAIAASASLHPCLEVVHEPKKEKSDNMAMKTQSEPSGGEKEGHASLADPLLDTIRSSVMSISNGVEEDSEKKVIEDPSVESINHEGTLGSKLCGDKAGEATEVAFSLEASSAVIFHQSDSSAKLGFDLNEGLSVDDGSTAEPVIPSVSGCSSMVYPPNLTPFTVSPMSKPSHVTVASPAKGPFLPPETLLKSKGEGGWKGSAATSAFRPAEPRKIAELSHGSSDATSDVAAGKQCHPPLNFDLNVLDETVLEDTASQNSAQQKATKSGVLSDHDVPIRGSVGLDLDLNRADESTESGQLSASTSQRLEVPLLSVRPASRGFPDGEANVLRDFDLNNGPGTDEVGAEQSRGRHTKGSTAPFLPSLRVNGNETSILTSWFPPGNSYSAVAIPSFLPDRDQPYPVVAAPGAQMILGSAAGGGAFGNDLYRGPVLSSSPTMTFPPAAAFSYAGFSFGSSFPLASTSFSGGSSTYIDSVSGGPCFPAIPTPLMGRAGAASSPYLRPNVISLPDGSTSGGSESNRKWGWQSLDLNAGPGSVDIEGREDRSSLTSRQLSVNSSQAFSAEQARIYQTAGGALKRKEPEGGWDTERIPYKQHPWQ